MDKNSAARYDLLTSVEIKVRLRWSQSRENHCRRCWLLQLLWLRISETLALFNPRRASQRGTITDCPCDFVACTGISEGFTPPHQYLLGYRISSIVHLEQPPSCTHKYGCDDNDCYDRQIDRPLRRMGWLAEGSGVSSGCIQSPSRVVATAAAAPFLVAISAEWMKMNGMWVVVETGSGTKSQGRLHWDKVD